MVLRKVGTIGDIVIRQWLTGYRYCWNPETEKGTLTSHIHISASARRSSKAGQIELKWLISNRVLPESWFDVKISQTGSVCCASHDLYKRHLILVLLLIRHQMIDSTLLILSRLCQLCIAGPDSQHR